MYDFSIYIAKTAVVFIVLFALFRVLGKRQLAQMNVYDLALIMALANAVQNAMTAGQGDLRVGIASSSTLLVLSYVLTRLFVRSQKLEKLLVGTPTVIVNRGKVLKQKMRRELVTEDELLEALHQHGLTRPEQAKVVVLEVDGSLSVIPQESS